VGVPVSVEVLFLEHGLLVEEALGESVVLLLDSFRFSFPNHHVQTGRAFHVHGLVSVLLSRRGSYGTPLARADFNQLVEEDLVVLINGDVALVSEEFFGLLPVLSVLLQHRTDFFSFTHRLC